MKSQWILGMLVVGGLVLSGLPARAEFNSGSTGEDGELTVAGYTQMQVQLQEDGVHNYTTISVGPGATLTFKANTLNTPVILLAQGDVTIAGVISVDGAEGVAGTDPTAGTLGSAAKGGPGGYPGGIGCIPLNRGGSGIGSPGGGPGGGAAATDPTPDESGWGRAGNGGSHFSAGGVSASNTNPAAPTYGDPRLLTLSGGSGGGGGNVYSVNATEYDGSGGGGGGGAILIASSTSIIVNGSINARGGTAGGVFGVSGGGGCRGGGGGAGGAVRLMANSLSGAGYVQASGGGGAANGGSGLILLEAFNFSGTVAHNCSPFSRQGYPTIVSLPPANTPTIRIVSIGGVPVPDTPGGSITAPDLTVPSSVENPVPIVIATTNVPDGAVVKLRIVMVNGEIVLADSSPVSGGNATASAVIPHAIGVIYTTADFNP